MRDRSAYRIIFVTGKGGVGKSSIAAATALQLARMGRSVLLVELGRRSYLGPFLNLPVGVDPVPWQPNVSVARWEPDQALREYVTHFLVFRAAADRVLDNPLMKALVGAAPSLSELAILGKLTAPMRYRWYRRNADIVVVDAYSTGQFMALLRAPKGLALTASAGPLHRQTQWICSLLADPEICEYRLVTVAEEMAIAEACELASDIRGETGFHPIVYCNKLLQIPDLPKFAGIDERSAAFPFLEQMRRTAARQRMSLRRLDQLDAGPARELPFVPTDDAHVMLGRLVEALRDGVRS
jgi:anion-transporting  ArsA/GET3 family ATPase